MISGNTVHFVWFLGGVRLSACGGPSGPPRSQASACPARHPAPAGRPAAAKNGFPTKGSALLAVLWLSAALAAIAFSVAATVRGELERSATAADGVRSYFLARGAIDRALLWMQWGGQHRNPDGTPRYWAPGMRRLHFEFPNGVAEVDFLPEAGKLNVNTIPPQELLRLLAALGVEPDRAGGLLAAILDWRSPAPQGLSGFDSHYLSLTPSFRARHASLEEVEELLLVKGMPPELFHGSYVRDADGKLAAQPGLRDCLSVYSNGGQVDMSSAQPAVLAAIGVPPDAIMAIVQARRLAPFQSPDRLRMFAAQLGPAGGRLMFGTGSITTLRATARIRLEDGKLSDLRRTVSALVKLAPNTADAPYHILRWYDQGGLSMGDLE
ncbi:MAG: general secretion pathway protein GspK [Acidobacteria bacterium]|nr:general secretion pathway protein GspK [Acidobacteriota bacterium]